jgi:hypothetical protein
MSDEKTVPSDDTTLALLRARIYSRNLQIISLYKNQLDDMEEFQHLVVNNNLREEIDSFIIDIKDSIGFK